MSPPQRPALLVYAASIQYPLLWLLGQVNGNRIMGRNEIWEVTDFYHWWRLTPWRRYPATLKRSVRHMRSSRLLPLERSIKGRLTPSWRCSVTLRRTVRGDMVRLWLDKEYERRKYTPPNAMAEIIYRRNCFPIPSYAYR